MLILLFSYVILYATYDMQCKYFLHFVYTVEEETSETKDDAEDQSPSRKVLADVNFMIYLLTLVVS